MGDIPRVPQVLPSSLVNQQVHRVDQSGDRRQERKEHEKPKDDVLELHDLDEPVADKPDANSEPFEDEGPLDIAV